MSHSTPCSRCKKTKNISEFYKDLRATNGLQSCCIECQKKWNKENSERLSAKKREWRKSPEVKIRLAKASKEYAKDNPEVMAQHRKKYYLANKDKVRQAFAKWAKENPERIKENKKRATQANPALYRSYSATRRARMRNAQMFLITKKEYKKLYSTDCFYCGNSANSIDHVIPLSRGGSHSIGNLVPACLHCNCSKKDKTIMEWRRRADLTN